MGSRSACDTMCPANVALDAVAIPIDDNKEGEAVELSGTQEHLAVASSIFSADFFLINTLGFSQSFGEIPS